MIRRAGELAAADTAGQPSWRFSRCWLRMLEATEAGGGLPAVDAAVADFDALPGDLPGRPALAGLLAEAMRAVGGLRDRAHVDRAAALCAIAGADPHPLPHLELTRAVIRAMELLIRTGQADSEIDPRAALAEVVALAARVGDRQPYSNQLATARLSLEWGVTMLDGDLSGQREVERTYRRLQETYASVPGTRAPLASLAAMTAVLQAAARGGVDDLTAELASLSANIEGRAPDDPERAALQGVHEMVSRHLRTMQRFRGPIDGAAEDLAALRAEVDRPGKSPLEHATALLGLGQAEMAQGTHDHHLLDLAVEHLGQAVAVMPPNAPLRPYYPFCLGSALLVRHDVHGRRPDLNRAIQALEQAREWAATPAEVNWAVYLWQLGLAYRRAGRRSLGAATGLDALRGHAWSVLLQSQTDLAMASVRHAAGDAVKVARWFIEDGDAAGAATALDAGRGLLLHAATQIGDVAEQLTARGEPDLAAQWRQAVAVGGPEAVHGVLRRRVLTVLGGLPDGPGDLPGSPNSRLLSPPSVHEIRAALTTLRADALVYLVPGDTGGGTAVVVPADAEPALLPLPRLHRQAAARLSATFAAAPWTRAGSPDLWRDLRAAAQSELERICEESWSSAIGPLLDHVGTAAGRPRRLVLIPMGELVRVPWHAARRRSGTGFEYAIHHAVFSYAASARLLCDVAWRPAHGITGDSLFVGDPDTAAEAPDLPAARAEAVEIRNAFYPDGRYLGRLADGSVAPDGPGNPGQLLAWLASHRAGAMLHLACHGVVRGSTDSDDTSYLLLAGGARLSAEDLVRTLQTSATRQLGLAVLAACSSGVSGRGYDEAFSVGTALLASGTRSVVSAQWSVPDRQTSALMFMFHHFLRMDGAAPADALRAAQLWMLDPGRTPPATMDRALTAALAGDGEIDIAAWAAFHHSGA